MDRMPMTQAGYERMRAELKRLKTVERRDVAALIEEARSHGDLRENADYDAAKEKQGMLEANIRDLEDKLARAEVIDVSKLGGDKVVFGATVTLYDIDADEEKTVTIVGELEADAKAGRISVSSPLARGLIGKQVDDVARIQTPGGTREYEISEVSFE
ncbi:MAG: transcription elongation factor GreA [Myxococcales bacterium]|nr:transcription elongation factor GreA [Myxococcales bacterium]MCB9538025.1 transcription elongation factor GreA [Myxococcales bacterium]